MVMYVLSAFREAGDEVVTMKVSIVAVKTDISFKRSIDTPKTIDEFKDEDFTAMGKGIVTLLYDCKVKEVIIKREE